jgi:hypothetical protein
VGLALPALLQLNVHNATLALSAAAGLLALAWLARAYGVEPGYAVDAALLALILGIVAGRAEVVVANLDYFRGLPLTTLVDPRVGGLGQRSLSAVGTAAYLAFAARRARWRYYAAAAAPALGLAAAITWAGLAFTGAAAGAEGRGPFPLPLPDQFGIVAPRFPLQFAMAGGHLLLAVAALLAFNRLLRPGVGLCLWASGAAALSALLDNFRAEVVYLLPGIPRALVADAALAVAWLVAAMLVLALGRREPPPPAEVGEAQPEPIAEAVLEA